MWAPGRGTSIALVGAADFAKLDLEQTYNLPRRMEPLYLCAGSAAAVPPGTILFASTSDSHYVKVFVESCGQTLRIRFTTYERKLVPVKPAATGLEAPVLKSPPDGVAFEHDPRDLVLAWSGVGGAASYTLELDCRGCCGPRWDAFCGDQEKGKVFLTMTDLKTPAYYTLWNGAYAGRWRACAKSADGKAGPWSPWWNFSFKK